MVDLSERLALRVNSKKTKAMVIFKTEVAPLAKIKHGNVLMEKVPSFNYLGCAVTTDGRWRKEIRRRINLAKNAFSDWKHGSEFKDRKLSTRIISKFVSWKHLVHSVVRMWVVDPLSLETRKKYRSRKDVLLPSHFTHIVYRTNPERGSTCTAKSWHTTWAVRARNGKITEIDWTVTSQAKVCKTWA